MNPSDITIAAEVSAELRADIATHRLLEERSRELADSIEPGDFYQPASTSAHLACGCEWSCAGFRHIGGRAVTKGGGYTKVCDLHEQAAEIVGWSDGSEDD